MAEWRFFPEGTVPYVSTPEFHRGRERAPHLEQPVHRQRLEVAADLVRFAAELARAEAYHAGPVTVSDLGCGDGGLLSLLVHEPAGGVALSAWGYDFQPSNAAGWAERGVRAEALDVFGEDWERVRFGDITIMTEVLEHLADPHAAVRWVAQHSPFLVASSPRDEHPGDHDECHAWAWDTHGYQDLLHHGGYGLVVHRPVGRFQVALAVKTPPGMPPGTAPEAARVVPR